MTPRFHAVIGGVFLGFIVLALVVGEVDAQTPATVRPLQHTRFVLPNGLVVLLNEDHSSPTVGAAVWYHVGGKDEPEGRLGYAHLCEHMLFEGSPNVPPGQFLSIMRAAGATSNRGAETSEDRTIYYQTVPSNQLETWLWLESDRMAVPFGAVQASRLDSVKPVLKLERQQMRENIPFGFAEAATISALYGGEHPYRDQGAPIADIEKATFDSMRAFCEPYYIPNNAVLSISGDIDPVKTRAMVERYFGPIKRGTRPPRVNIRATQMSAERRMVLEDPRATAPALRLAWSGAGFAHEDRMALTALAAAMQGDRASGLTKLLVSDRKLATSVAVNHFDLEKGGVFQIEINPVASASLSAIEDVVDSVVNAARTTPPPAQVIRRFESRNTTQTIANLQARKDRADMLAQGEGFAGDPVAYAAQVKRANALTPADVQRAAAKYLTPGRVVLSKVPAGKRDLASKPDRAYENAPQTVPELES
jgi:zinc protease